MALARPVLLVLLAMVLSDCRRSTVDKPAPTKPSSAESALSSSVITSSSTLGLSSPNAAPRLAPRPASNERALVSLGITITKVHKQKRFSWRQLQGLNWQAVATGLPTLPDAAESRQEASGACPNGMIRIEGEYALDSKGKDNSDEILLAQNATCSQWMTTTRGVGGLCFRFDREKWRKRVSSFPRKTMRFCIDRFEFPNIYGEFPLVVTRYIESSNYCKRVGKRLCTESEWTFACEGEKVLPFPYGYNVDKTVCNIDVLAAGAPKDTYSPRTLPATARGIDMAWQGMRSGASPDCRSPFGVEDMTGNVDEWTTSVRSYGYRMILKGGHWGRGRHRCRPQTRGHGPMYVRHDQGFRCCKSLE